MIVAVVWCLRLLFIECVLTFLPWSIGVCAGRGIWFVWRGKRDR